MGESAYLNEICSIKICAYLTGNTVLSNFI